MKELFYEIIQEAANAEVKIDNEIWNIGFNTFIREKNIEYYNDRNLSTLIIKNESEFFKHLEIYIKKELEANRKSINFSQDNDKNRMKLLISYLFVNASPIDFANPIEYLKKRIAYLNDETFKEKSYISIGSSFDLEDKKNIYLMVKKVTQDIRMETPKRLELSIANVEDNTNFNLPSISYGIRKENNTKYCDIYCIQNHNQEENKKNIQFQKRISRILYKVNDDNIDDDIKDVSVSSVLALSIFLNLLKSNDIEHINCILYLPVRYLSRDISAKEHLDKVKSQELEIRNDRIQNNITNKFLRTIRRVAQQIEGINIKNIDSVDNGYLEIEISENNYRASNTLLKGLTNSILKR